MAEATAFRISLLELGAAWETATAILRYSLGTERQTAKTILRAWEGAADAAAFAIAAACLGCLAAATPAATDAMSGAVLAIAPTMAGAAAELISTAASTTSMVVVVRSRLFARRTKSAALAGSSAAGTGVSTSLKGLAFGASLPEQIKTPRKATTIARLVVFFISFQVVMDHGDAQMFTNLPNSNRLPPCRQWQSYAIFPGCRHGVLAFFLELACGDPPFCFYIVILENNYIGPGLGEVLRVVGGRVLRVWLTKSGSRCLISEKLREACEQCRPLTYARSA
jgi:hypothetical protein